MTHRVGLPGVARREPDYSDHPGCRLVPLEACDRGASALQDVDVTTTTDPGKGLAATFSGYRGG